MVIRPDTKSEVSPTYLYFGTPLKSYDIIASVDMITYNPALSSQLSIRINYRDSNSVDQATGGTHDGLFAAQALAPDVAVESDGRTFFYLFFYDAPGGNDISRQGISYELDIDLAALQPIFSEKSGEHLTQIGMQHQALGDGCR